MASNRSLLGLDVGQAWIGVARASTAAGLAEPLKPIKTETAIDEIKQLAAEHHVDLIILGLPRNLDGQETGQTHWTRQWAKQLQAEINLPIDWIDEALTSHKPDLRSQNSDLRENTHSQAAARILQDWVDSQLTGKTDDGKVL